MLTTSRSKVDYLTQSLKLVTDELQSTIDFELNKLKAEEQALKGALKLKTRQDLITTMERELEMEPLYANDYLNHTHLKGSSHSFSLKNQDLYNSKNLSESINISNENLNLSNLLLNKLNDECNICSTDLNRSMQQNEYQTAAMDFLSQSANSSVLKTQYNIEDNSEFINPNVVRLIKIIIVTLGI